MTCYCDAYPFPHRAGGGDCPGGRYCPECGSTDLVSEHERYTDDYGLVGDLVCERCGWRGDL